MAGTKLDHKRRKGEEEHERTQRTRGGPDKDQENSVAKMVELCMNKSGEREAEAQPLRRRGLG